MKYENTTTSVAVLLTLLLTTAMALTPATAQAEGTTYVYDASVSEGIGIPDIAFMDNRTLIGGKYLGILYAWQVPSGNKRWSVDVGDSVMAVALPSHNPHFIAYGGGNSTDKNYSIRMRYSDDGGWRGSVDGHTSTVYSLAFKPNSYLLASGSNDGTIRIWDVGDRDNLRHVRTLRGHTDRVYSVAWSPDGRTLASASNDGTVRLWNPNNGINFAVLRGHKERVRSVAWSPNSRTLASGSYDGTVCLWNADTYNRLRVLQGTVDTARFDAVAFSPDGQTLIGTALSRRGLGGSGVSGLSDIYLWNPNTGALKTVLQTGASDIEFSPNGQILATTANVSNRPFLWRLVTADVTGNGVVNFWDIVEVGKNYGKSVAAGANRRADVDGDGKVDIDDLILVAKAVDAAAAPALAQEEIETGGLQAADVRQWIRDAKQADADPVGIAALDRLLVLLSRRDLPVPKETVLLANYPNPFNPETWIPYQLSETAEVAVSIHASDGKLVRTLELGQLPAGIYQTKGRAAYWDGRNTLNEPVASGVYFYTLTAGDFKATRKMLIRK